MRGIKTWEELTIQDNFIFQRVMRNKRLCRLLIEIILGIKLRSITFPTTEKSIDVSYDSKSVRLDVYAEDENGVLYDIEMQTTDNASPDELPKRTRYYQAMMDMDVLEKGADYVDLRTTYIIFICTFDPFGEGRSIYTFEETCKENKSLSMGDKTTKIFLNSKGSREGLHPDVAAFLDYVEGHAAKGHFTKTMAAEVERVKEHKETRVEYMTLAMEMKRQKKAGYLQGQEAGREEGRVEGREEGRVEGLFLSALGMLQEKFPVEQVARITKLSVEQIRELGKTHGLL